MDAAERDTRIRLEAFQFLDQQRLVFAGELPYEMLREGFRFEGQRVPLIGPQGIFKPRILPLSVPLSITTAPAKPERPRPYEDAVGADNLLRYKYRGTDPHHHENGTCQRL